MKFIKVFTIVIFATSCVTNKNTIGNLKEVDLLFVNNQIINSIIDKVKMNYTKEYNFSNQIFVVRTEDKKDELEVVFSVYDRSDFANCFNDNLFPLYGLYKYNRDIVLVYGKDSQELFKKRDQKESLDILKCQERVTDNSISDIPYPPIVFEPIVWIYSGNSKNLIFKEQAQFNVIK